MKSHNTFSAKIVRPSDNNLLALDGIPGSCLEGKIAAVTRLSGGINSETYKVVTRQRRSYVVKRYQSRPGDLRDRLSTEFFGLSFLWANGIRNIPQPLFVNQSAQVALYQFIAGDKISPGEIAGSDIDAAADFVGKVHALRGAKGARKLPDASEACFSLRASLDCVAGRIDRLRKLSFSNGACGTFHAYVDAEIRPLFHDLKSFVSRQAEKKSLKMGAVLKAHERTLSPSDFGFHNAIRSAGGEIFFIDFEYFGWDDPAKLIADFYLQPAVPVPWAYRKRFFRKARANFREDVTLEQRLAVLYPLLAFKWGLIMLNPFLHSGGDREGQLLECLHRSKKRMKIVKTLIARAS